MVKIEEFLPTHFEKLVELHKKQEAPTTPFIIRETLPKIGFVVSNEKEYVAFGFLRRLEGGFAQLDTFVTNPDSSPEDRNEALDLLTAQLINEAKALELRGIYAITQNESIVRRAQIVGFNSTVQILLSMLL